MSSKQTVAVSSSPLENDPDDVATFDNEFIAFLSSDVMFIFIEYLDAITLVHFYLMSAPFALACQSPLTYWTLSTFVQQQCFDLDGYNEEQIATVHEAELVPATDRELDVYVCDDMMSLKQKMSLECDIELTFRNKTAWNETWNHQLTLDTYQEYTKLYHGYQRDQSTKFVHYEQQIPSKEENEKHSQRPWMECVNIEDLMKFFFDSESPRAMITLDCFILDYEVARTMESPPKFTQLENVTVCFIRNKNFRDSAVYRHCQNSWA